MNLEEKKRWLRDHAHLCPAPYVKRDFRIQALDQFGMTCCCNLDTSLVTESDPTRAVNAVIKAMDSGCRAQECARCISEEAQDHTSERMRLMLHWSAQELENFRNQRQLPDSQEVEMSVKFSNECNLACRSCQPDDSTLFSKITNTTVKIAQIRQDLSQVSRYWIPVLREIDQAYQQHDNIIVHTIGGEPFVTQGFDRLVNWICEQGMASRVTLRLTTNFTVPIDEYWLLRFHQFRRIQIVASIDSVEENYHQVRWPAQWNKIDRNLNDWAQIAATWPDKFNHTCVIMVFTINNIFYLDRILDWWHRWSQSRPDFNISLLNLHVYRPDFLRPEIIPEPYRQPLLERLGDLDQHTIFDHDCHQQLKDFLISTRYQLQQHNGDLNLWYDYLCYTADYDCRTGSDSTQNNSRLFDLLTPEDLEIYHQQLEKTNTLLPIYAHDRLL